jgi:hypothetical protein
MRGRGLLILALIVVALAIFIGLYEHKLPSSDQRREQAKHVLQMKKDAIDAITLERPDQPTVEIVRVVSPQADRETESDGPSSTRWTLRKPWDFPAATDAVDGLLDAVVNLQQKRSLTDYKPADLGLDAPRATITLHSPQGERTLEIGAEVPGFSSMAVRRAGDQVAYVVGDGLWSDLNKKAGAWRSHDVLAASRSDIRSVSWKTHEGGMTLDRKGSDFRVSKPFEDVADADRVDRLMTALTGLRVDHFVDEAAGSQGGPNEEGNGIPLQVSLVDRPRPIDVRLEPAAQDGELTVHYLGQTAVCKSDLLQRLDGVPAAWRSKAWTTLHVYDIHQATIRDATGTVVLSRTDDGWQRDDKDIPFEAVTDLLDTVTGAKADSVRASGNEAAPAGPPAFAVELQPLSGGEAQNLSLFSDGTALNSARAVRLQMPHDLLGHLQKRLGDLRAAKPTPQEKSPATPTADKPAAN